MTERGGPTTQSGILYQNSISALFLAKLCDSNSQNLHESVQEVRLEAPEDVDDTVVTYSDNHKEYIQAKENIDIGGIVWNNLWKKLINQYKNQDFDFDSDLLCLYFGNRDTDLVDLKELVSRATHGDSYRTFIGRLTESHKKLLEKIREVPAILSLGNDQELVNFLSRVHISIWERDHIERDLVQSWVPESNKSKKEVFRLLRDRVGEKARVRDKFTSNELRKSLSSEVSDLIFSIPSDIKKLKTSIFQCSSQLRQQKHTIANTGLHIQQDVVGEIVSWAKSKGDSENNVSVLLDQAGMGKTVVLHDVQKQLESQNVDVLALKADSQLVGIPSISDLSNSLGLEHRIERIIGQLSKLNRVVVILDQVDALSLSMSHDAKSLKLAFDLISRLRYIPNVRLIFSCRVFDFNSDYRFNEIIIDRRFSLSPFSKDNVRRVLKIFGVDFGNLPEITQVFLQVPLHLNIYVKSIEVDTPKNTSIRNILDLYDLLWQKVILRNEMKSPTITDRIAVLNEITKFMAEKNITSIPKSFFHSKDQPRYQNTLSWLASNGILVENGANWTLLHQTFFDYCFARNFVENNKDLHLDITTSPQGIFERPKLISVLTYLRGKNNDGYLPVFKQLITNKSLRFHLYDLLVHWFGALSNPTDNEWHLYQEILLNDEHRSKLLFSSQGNPGWFTYLHDDYIHHWISKDSKDLDSEVVPYLSSMIDIEQEKVINLVRPFLNSGELWVNRIRKIIGWSRKKYSPELIELFKEVTYKLPELDQQHIYQIAEISMIDSKSGVNLLRHILDRYLMKYEQSKKDSSEANNGSDQFRMLGILDETKSFRSTKIDEAFLSTSRQSPKEFIENILPWLEDAINLEEPIKKKRPYYSYDSFYFGWYSEHFHNQNTIINGIKAALIKISQQNSEYFLSTIRRLANSEYKTPHQILCYVLGELANDFHQEAYEYLTTDSRRLNIGESDQFETRRLIRAIYPNLEKQQRENLEKYILKYDPINKNLGVDGLRRRGIEQYRILLSIPKGLLSSEGLDKLNQLKRKFPDYKLPREPKSFEGGFVGSPISKDNVQKMSDNSWLKAMNKYDGKFEHKDILRGGARQLSSLLEEEIKKDPGRFWHLFKKIPESIDDDYARAYLKGFSESEAEDAWLFKVIRIFANQGGRNIKRAIAWAIEKRSTSKIPSDLIEMLQDIVYGNVGEDELWWLMGPNNGDVYQSYLNSDRGSAFHVLMKYFMNRDSDFSLQIRWKLVEFASIDESSALRIGAIHHLTYLIRHDKDRALDLFEKLMEGHDVLRDSAYVRNFIYWALYKSFLRLYPYILLMLDSELEETQEQGAQLACISSLSKNSLESWKARWLSNRLTRKVLRGPISNRRGAARIFSRNLPNLNSKKCENRVIFLLNEEDEQIHREISIAFFSFNAEHMKSLNRFIEEYAMKACVVEFRFVEFIQKYGSIDFDFTLDVISKLLSNKKWISNTFQISQIMGNFIRVVLLIYTAPTTTQNLQIKAMDLFDHLMELNSGVTNRVLEEWDRH